MTQKLYLDKFSYSVRSFQNRVKQIEQIENIKRYIYFKNGYFYGKGDLGNFPIDKY